MTGLLNTASAPAGVWAWSLGPSRLLRGLDRYETLGARAHLEIHGPVRHLDRDALVAACEAVNLAGRGGAGFPVARKLTGLGSGRPVVVVNGSESEPTSRKDRVLLTRAPHLVLDGARVVAAAIGARRIWIEVHDRGAEHAVRSALAERPDSLGMTVVRGVPDFVAGEARAVIRALDGGPGVPIGRRTLPTQRGVGGAPTFLSNVETFAQLAVLARLGPHGYAACGTTEEPGTTLLTVSGAVSRAGVVEISHGTSLGEVLAATGARPPRAVVLGGYHGSWLLPHPAMPLSRDAAKSSGSTLGAGVLMVLDESTCALGELETATAWLARESAGQCGPCRFGLPAMADDLGRLRRGEVASLTAARRHAQLVLGRGACAHPDGASRFVTSGLDVLGEELDAHARHGSCGRPVLGQLGVPTGRAR